MSKVINKIPLCRIEIKYFKSTQGVEGKVLFERFDALDNIIGNNIDEEFRSFISHPVTEENLSVTFHGKKSKDQPKILSELTGIEGDKYKEILNKTLQHYKQVIDGLNKGNEKLKADFLSKTIKFIDNRFVYCYDEKVVLGVWGLQLKENLREDISEIRKNLIVPTKNDIPVDSVEPIEPDEPAEPPIPSGIREDKPEVIDNPTPEVPIELEKPKKRPWHLRFIEWLKGLFFGRGCLRSLLWLLLLLLLLFLLFSLLRGCDSNRTFNGGGALSENDQGWLADDPNVGKDGGKYDPNNPYTPKPSPPGFEGVLPPNEGVLAPLPENPEIIPGNPNIIGNRLNILMENDDKSIMDLAKAFKEKYPDSKYQVVYYDNVVKRMQIEIPTEEREKIKEEIPTIFAPDFDLFVFDESLFEGASIPNDPAISDASKSWYLKAVNAFEAWEITKGSSKISIAIVDNGFNLQHPELKQKVVAPYNVWSHSSNVFAQKEDHGTHVAGIALATADNGQGISGIAPESRFMPIQVANEHGLMTTTSVLDGILYALYQGADVVNVSLGSQFNGISRIPEDAQKELIQNRFKEEERLWRRVMRIAANHNSTLVIAAGNDNVLTGIDALQRPELFITVSAIDQDGNNPSKAAFSNYGSRSTVSAPGVNIYSTVGKNGYTSMDGTSMAAPIVSGAVALMKSLNDSLTSKQIICILQTTGKYTRGQIGKLIQVDKALDFVQSGAEPDCAPKPSTGDVQILLSWNNYNDLDLICTDPTGQTISYKNRSVSSGGQLEIDMNVEFPDSQSPIENIFWRPGTAPDGTYNVYLQYFKNHEPTIDETPYTITIKYDGNVEELAGVIKSADRAKFVKSFTVGNRAGKNESQGGDDKRSQLEKERARLQAELDRVERELKKLSANY
ncbi:S8 family peptidase [Mongoliitalea lutea]|uniref:Peptidase S8/S53 domain-containing protein n=1 Tax=Mongoliitalea lutea TaxID=849756 RepID=A0A8J3CX30_9BACT|nr:S8 family serine peptidase [Mongoliitalea lutea]GHB36315.1 hypothetical protein GCM10008106_17000 [Mongoliitalea lutea]